jgi:hypothetical protein
MCRICAPLEPLTESDNRKKWKIVQQIRRCNTESQPDGLIVLDGDGNRINVGLRYPKRAIELVMGASSGVWNPPRRDASEDKLIRFIKIQIPSIRENEAIPWCVRQRSVEGFMPRNMCLDLALV